VPGHVLYRTGSLCKLFRPPTTLDPIGFRRFAYRWLDARSQDPLLTPASFLAVVPVSRMSIAFNRRIPRTAREGHPSQAIAMASKCHPDLFPCPRAPPPGWYTEQEGQFHPDGCCNQPREFWRTARQRIRRGRLADAGWEAGIREFVGAGQGELYIERMCFGRGVTLQGASVPPILHAVS
jgi:hypothetical protein